MNQDLALLIQSYVDGELSGRQARRVADWVENEPEARALFEELRQTRSWLTQEVEMPRPVPATREFYWSQLESAIARLERERTVNEPPMAAGWLSGWRKYAAPLAAAALMLLLAVPAANYLSGERGDPYLDHLAEVENLSPNMGSYSFRNQSGNMFVVWLYDRSPDLFEQAEGIEESLPQ